MNRLTTTTVTPGFETAHLLSTLRSFSPRQIGNDAFIESYCIRLERLSIQAHAAAARLASSREVLLNNNNDINDGWDDGEYVIEALSENVDASIGMIETLLSLEFWRERILFHQESNVDSLAEKVAVHGNGLRVAFVLHAETAIVSLLSLMFYDGVPAALSGNEEVLLSLVDYCARQLVFLGTPPQTDESISKQKNPLPPSRLAAHLTNRSRTDEIRDSYLDSRYRTAVSSVSLARYLCEIASEDDNASSPGLVSRIWNEHDYHQLMIRLIEEPPWTRRRPSEKNGEWVWEKLNGEYEWEAVPASELLKVTKLEGQPWLALYHLTCTKVGREAYGLDEFRKNTLMRVRKYLCQTLLDQIPVLEDVARYLDELSIVGVPPAGQHRGSGAVSCSGLLMQRVDSLRESIVGKRQDEDPAFWKEVIQSQWNDIFSKLTDAEDPLLRRIGSEIYGDPGLENDLGSAVVSNDLPRNHVNGWKSALVKPIEKVTLSISGRNAETTVFELVTVDGDDGTVTDTPLGPFRRLKLNPKLVSDDTSEAIFPLGKVSANIQFTQSDHKEVSLSLDSLDLPTSRPNSTPNSYEELGIALPEHFTAKEWRQLGDLHDKNMVLQLGFKRMECGTVPAGCTYLRGYLLSNAFISQPAVS